MQFPHVKSDGWLLGSHEKINLSLLHETISTVIKTDIRPKFPHKAPPSDFEFGLNYRPVWDGIEVKKRSKDHKLYWAIHVEMLEEDRSAGRWCIKTALQLSKLTKHFNGLVLRYVQVLDTSADSNRDKQNKERNLHRHSDLQASMVHHFITDISALDKQSEEIPMDVHNTDPRQHQSFTIRRALYSLGPHAKPNCPLFLSIEPDSSGFGHYVTFPKIFRDEALEILKGLPLYLAHGFGRSTEEEDEILSLFTRSGQE